MNPVLLSALVLALALAVAGDAAAATCKEPDLKALPEDHPQCLFFAGTRAFRAKQYAVARDHWFRLKDLPAIPREFERYRQDAYNNLGFLYFNGWGAPEDPIRAVGYWKAAYREGHDEAAYHLCHVHAARDRPEYDRVLGLEYCREALRRYAAPRDKPSDEIVRQLRHYLAALEKK